MAKFICSICGYVHEGMDAPVKCPICKSPSSQFTPSDEYSKDEDQGVIEVGNFDGGANELQTFEQSQLKCQDVFVEEMENTSVDSIASLEESPLDNASYYGNGKGFESHIASTADVYVYGNFMSLIHATDFATNYAMTGDWNFAKLFRKEGAQPWDPPMTVTTIKSHPTNDIVLPATSLTNN